MPQVQMQLCLQRSLSSTETVHVSLKMTLKDKHKLLIVKNTTTHLHRIDVENCIPTMWICFWPQI